jgi:serine/threonine protein kinase
MPEDIEKSEAVQDFSLFGAEDPLVGKVLDGRWKILQFLGEGSMSSVYQAEHLQTGELVVLKMLHQHVAANSSNVRRFDSAAREVMALRHPRIAKFLDIHLDPNGEVFLVLECLPGESLEDILAKSGHLPSHRTIEIFSQVCEGLEYAHEDNVLHRDLKPSNIILVDSGKIKDDVKLADFGVAKLLAEESEDLKTSGYITRTKEVFGSPMYMSPEQCMGKKLDGRSDIYSLGCVMYETLTGKPPFVGKNVLETAYKHMNEAPKPIAPDITQDKVLMRLETVIFKALAKDPNERYQSISQLKSDLAILSSASEIEWAANTFALKKAPKVKKKKQKQQLETGGSKPWISFEVAVIGSVSLVIMVVIGFWSISFLNTESSDGPPFNNDLLWVVKDRTKIAEQADFAQQEDGARTELSRAERETGTDSKEYAKALGALANVYVNSGHWSDAAPLLGHLADALKKLKDTSRIGECYGQLGYVYFMQNQLQEAEKFSQLGVKEMEEKGAARKFLELPLQVLGDIYSQNNNLAKADEVYTKLFSVVEPNKTVDTLGYIKAAVKLGDVYRRENKMQQAEDLYRQGIDAYKQVIHTETQFFAKALYGMGLILAKEGKSKEAEQDFRESLNVAKSVFNGTVGPNNPEFLSAIRRQCLEIQWKTNPVGAFESKFTGGDNTTSK